MELVSIDKDSSLTADRSTVSDEAFAVWKHYLTKRNDVEEFQLDDLNNTLTPELEDNCKQRAFDMRFGEDEPDVYGKPNDAARKKIKKKHMELSPITKVYKKTNRDVLDFLEENDLVIRRMKLLIESWRKFLKEDAAARKAFADELIADNPRLGRRLAANIDRGDTEAYTNRT